MARRPLSQSAVPGRIGNGREDGSQEANPDDEDGMDQRGETTNSDRRLHR